jgi:mono/diheme cytochrome c family protein
MKPAPLVRGLAATLVLLSVAAAAVAFRSASAAAPAAAPVASGPSKGDPALGKALFTKNCVVCHKADGTGGVKLTGNPTPNWKDAKTWADPVRAKDDYFRDCITNGKVKSGMVAWGKSGQLKPADIENAIAYIKTFKPKK